MYFCECVYLLLERCTEKVPGESFESSNLCMSKVTGFGFVSACLIFSNFIQYTHSPFMIIKGSFVKIKINFDFKVSYRNFCELPICGFTGYTFFFQLQYKFNCSCDFGGKVLLIK